MASEDPGIGPPSPIVAGFARACGAADVIDALADRGSVDQALLYGAAAEAGDLLAGLEAGDDDPPPPA